MSEKGLSPLVLLLPKQARKRLSGLSRVTRKREESKNSHDSTSSSSSSSSSSDVSCARPRTALDQVCCVLEHIAAQRHNILDLVHDHAQH